MLVKAKKKFDFSPDGLKIVSLAVGDEIEVKTAAEVVDLIKAGFLSEIKPLPPVVKAISSPPSNKMAKGPETNKSTKRFGRK